MPPDHGNRKRAGQSKPAAARESGSPAIVATNEQSSAMADDNETPVPRAQATDDNIGDHHAGSDTDGSLFEYDALMEPGSLNSVAAPSDGPKEHQTDAADDIQDEPAGLGYRMANYFRYDGRWYKKEGVMAELSHTRYNFTPDTSSCIRVIYLDYDIARFRLGDDDKAEIDELYDERDAMIARFEQVTAEFARRRTRYMSNSTFIIRTRAAIRSATEMEIARFCRVPCNITKDDVDRCIPSKVDILVCRFIDPRKFSSQIASMLALLGRTDLMVCGRMKSGSHRPTPAISSSCGTDEERGLDSTVAMEEWMKQDKDLAKLHQTVECYRATVDKVEDKVNGVSEMVNGMKAQSDKDMSTVIVEMAARERAGYTLYQVIQKEVLELKVKIMEMERSQKEVLELKAKIVEMSKSPNAVSPSSSARESPSLASQTPLMGMATNEAAAAAAAAKAADQMKAATPSSNRTVSQAKRGIAEVSSAEQRPRKR